MADRERLIKTLTDLIRIDSPTGEEDDIDREVSARLAALGFEIYHDSFNNIIAKMQPMLDQLSETASLSRIELQGIPKRGVYIFYEDESPIYVGRSNRLKQRILEHGKPSSRHNSATFAFNIALAAAAEDKITLPKATRTQMEIYPPFRHLYDQAKDRVAAMKIRVIEIKDPIEQTIFEVYAALALQTHNSFDNH